MMKYLLFFLFPLLAFSQEQVSDVHYYGNESATYLPYQMAFAQIEGVQYLIQIKDEIEIYKYAEDSLVLLYSIPKMNENLWKPDDELNRSYHRIKNGIFYLFYNNGIQVIDIAKGEIIDQVEISGDRFKNVRPLNYYNELFVFSGARVNTKKVYILNTVTDALDSLPEVTGSSKFIYNKNKIYISKSGNVEVYDIESKEKETIFQSSNGLMHFQYSPQDSTVNIIEYNGQVWKINEALQVIKTACKIDKPGFKFAQVTGHKLTTVESTKYQSGIDSVIIYDIPTGKIDFTFNTISRKSFANNFEFVANEYHEKDVTIFGYFGMHPSDAPDDGLYYIINHKSNSAITMEGISRIDSHTAFKNGDQIYCVGAYTSFWFSYQVFLKIDLVGNTVQELKPSENFGRVNFITLGFHNADGTMLLATNTTEENPHLWKKNALDSFSLVSKLDFTQDLGINNVNKIFPHDDKLYFSNRNAIYSLWDDCTEEITHYEPLSFSNYTGMTIASYNGTIAVIEQHDKKYIARILNTMTGKLDSVVRNGILQESSVHAIGSIIHFKLENGSKFYFDLKTKEIVASTLSFLSKYDLTIGKNTSLLKENYSRYTLFNYKTNEIKTIELNTDRYSFINEGYEDSYYFAYNTDKGDSIIIKLYRKDGTLSTIYKGRGNYPKYFRSSDGRTTFIHMTDNNGSILIANDLVSTEVKEYTINDKLNIVNADRNKLLLTTQEGSTVHYWLYEAFKPINKIFAVENKSLSFARMTDSLIVLTFSSNREIFKYNTFTHSAHSLRPLKSNVGYNFYNSVIQMNNRQFLFGYSTPHGYEPTILDVEKDSLYLLKDINQGIASSYPYHFTKYKNYIYFTAVVNGKSRQWFRMPSGNTVDVKELPLTKDHWTLYPVPTQQQLYIDQDIDDVTIYDMQGKKWMHLSQYHADQPINTSTLPTGMYIINGQKNGHPLSRLFSIVR